VGTFAKDFAEAGRRIDIPPELLKTTRETQASKVQWVNEIPQVGTLHTYARRCNRDESKKA